MKKMLALVMCVAMLVSAGALVASAATGTAVTDNFTPAGDYEITWDPNVATKIELDGDISDWTTAGYTNYQITTDNLIAWKAPFDTNFEINAYYVSDADYLYVAFWIVDDDFVASSNSAKYDDGDAFQIAIDFNRELQKTMAEDPELLENPKNIFYSFDCVTDGEFVFFRDEKMKDSSTGKPKREMLTESEGYGVKGAGAATDTGWCAEFALSWDMLFEDFAYKAYIDEYSAILDKANDLQLGITLCYLDRSEPMKTAAAAGTFQKDGELGWTPADNGMSLTLKWAEGVTINCEGIVSPADGEEYVTGMEEEETEPEETTTEAAEETTTAPAEETTTAPAEETTTAPAEETTTAPAEESSSAAETKAPAKEDGCGSVVATGAVVAVLAAAAAAVALKKKD